jgi:hypothetical protein
MLYNLKGKIRLYNPPKIDKTLTKEDYCADAKATGDELAKRVGYTDIADNVSTQDTNKVLSARQGVLLQKKIDDLSESVSNIAKVGQTIYYTTEDKNVDSGDAFFNPEYIETNGTPLAVGSMILTPSGRLFRIISLPYGDVEVINARYLTNLSAKPVENASHGVSIYYTTAVLDDSMADSIYPFDFSQIELNGATPIEGDLLIDSSMRVYRVTDVYGNTADAPWVYTLSKARFPTTLPNPHPLVINRVSYDGTQELDLTEKINELIDAKLAALQN